MAPDNIICCPIAFASKSVTGAEHGYSNIEQEALGILHGLEKCHLYCFSREVLIITDHKLLVSIFKKDIATLSQHIQCILLKIHQYWVQIIYKPGPEIFTADWLLWHNHMEGKDKPIKDMDIRKEAIQSVTDILDCMSMSQIQQASPQDDHLQYVKSFIITDWSSTKDEMHTELKPYWSYKDELAIIDGVILRGRHIVIHASLKQ